MILLMKNDLPKITVSRSCMVVRALRGHVLTASGHSRADIGVAYPNVTTGSRAHVKLPVQMWAAASKSSRPFEVTIQHDGSERCYDVHSSVGDDKLDIMQVTYRLTSNGLLGGDTFEHTELVVTPLCDQTTPSPSTAGSYHVPPPKSLLLTTAGWSRFEDVADGDMLYMPVRGQRVGKSAHLPCDKAHLKYTPYAGWIDTRYHHDSTTGSTLFGRIPLNGEHSYGITTSNLDALRVLINNAVDLVLQGAALHEVLPPLREFVTQSDNNVEPYYHHADPAKIWRGLLQPTPDVVPVERAEIAAKLAVLLPIAELGVVEYCGSCRAPLYSWFPQETAFMSNGRVMRYCSESCAVNRVMIRDSLPRPDKRDYGFDVARHMGFDEARTHDKIGGMRKFCGVELEVAHKNLEFRRLADSVVGGTIYDKKAQLERDPSVKPLKFDGRLYRSFGAIPTRDGSLDDTYGVEWVFRPTSNAQMKKDTAKFISRLGPYVHYDSTEWDAEEHGTEDEDNYECDSYHTYGMHIHQTATGVYRQKLAKIRLAYMSAYFEDVMDDIGGREANRYAVNYTASDGVIDNLHNIRQIPNVFGVRKNLISRVEFMSQYGSRYMRVNISGRKPTIEFRYPKSLMDANHVALNIDFAAAFMEFAGYKASFARYWVKPLRQWGTLRDYRAAHRDMKGVIVKDFIAFVRDNRKFYPDLNKYLENRYAA